MIKNLINSLKELHILHTWSAWETTKSGPIDVLGRFNNGSYIPYNSLINIGLWMVQERTCQVCQKVKVKSTKIEY